MRKLKANTTIIRYEEQELSLAAIELIPDQLQTRADTSMEWVARLCEAIAMGEPVPPIIVFRDDQGRLLLADGFHRFEAHKHLGLKTIHAQIREGSLTEAMLAGLEANYDEGNRGRKIELRDRKHAVELMIRNGANSPGTGTWDWGDITIARKCGVSGTTVTKIRATLIGDSGISFPDKILVTTSRHPDGYWKPYRSLIGGKPRVSAAGQISVCGKIVSVGKDQLIAEAKRDALVAEVSTNKTMLRYPGKFAEWLLRRGIHTEPPREEICGMRLLDGVPLIPLQESKNAALFEAIGVAWLASRVYSRTPVIVGYTGSLKGRSQKAISILACAPSLITFMTPEEVVAKFGPLQAEDVA